MGSEEALGTVLFLCIPAMLIYFLVRYFYGPLFGVNPAGGKWSSFERYLIPQYDELALFLMSSAFLLVFVHEVFYRGNTLAIRSQDIGLPVALAVLFFTAGLALSVYHVFVDRPKARHEKAAMLFFAVIACGASGIMAGMHIAEESIGLMLIFPLWNIASGLLLLGMYRAGSIDEENISDTNTRPLRVAFGLLVIILIFVLASFVLELHWAVVFSICVAYASSFSAFVTDLASTEAG